MTKSTLLVAVGLLALWISPASAQDCSTEPQSSQIECLSRRVEALQQQIDLLAKRNAADRAIEQLIDEKIRRAIEGVDEKLKQMTEPRVQRID